MRLSFLAEGIHCPSPNSCTLVSIRGFRLLSHTTTCTHAHKRTHTRMCTRFRQKRAVYSFTAMSLCCYDAGRIFVGFPKFTPHYYLVVGQINREFNARVTKHFKYLILPIFWEDKLPVSCRVLSPLVGKRRRMCGCICMVWLVWEGRC